MSAVCDLDLPGEDVRFVARYVEATARFFARRDAGGVLDERALNRTVTMRDLLYHLEHVRRRLPLTRYLRGKRAGRPFFYPGGYVDLLPFFLSSMTEAVYVDAAYFAASSHPQAAFMASATTLITLCEELSEDRVEVLAHEKSRLDLRLWVGQVQRRLTFARSEWDDGAAVSRLMPAGAGVYYGVEQPTVTDRESPLGNIMRSLSPDFALIPTAIPVLDGFMPVQRHQGERATYTWWALPG